MRINKEIIKKFLEEALNDDSEEFDEIEADFEFEFEDCMSTCSKVRTSSFKIELSEYEITFDASDNPVTVSGNAHANYIVKGRCWDGDEEAGGYLECAEGDSESDFRFLIEVNKSDFEKSTLTIDID